MTKTIKTAFTVGKYFPLVDTDHGYGAVNKYEVGQSTYFLYDDHFVRYEYYDADHPPKPTNRPWEDDLLRDRLSTSSHPDFSKDIDAAYASGGDSASIWLIKGNQVWQRSLDAGDKDFNEGQTPTTLAKHFHMVPAPFTEAVRTVLPFIEDGDEKTWLFSGTKCCKYANDGEVPEVYEASSKWPNFDFAAPVLNINDDLTAEAYLFKGNDPDSLRYASVDLTNPSPNVTWKSAKGWIGPVPVKGRKVFIGPTDCEFTVPEYASKITIELWGPGGDAGNAVPHEASPWNPSPGVGGAGAYIREAPHVTPGQKFEFHVGGPGDCTRDPNSTIVAAGGGHGGGGDGGGSGGAHPTGFRDKEDPHLIGAGASSTGTPSQGLGGGGNVTGGTSSEKAPGGTGWGSSGTSGPTESLCGGGGAGPGGGRGGNGGNYPNSGGGGGGGGGAYGGNSDDSNRGVNSGGGPNGGGAARGLLDWGGGGGGGAGWGGNGAGGAGGGWSSGVSRAGGGAQGWSRVWNPEAAIFNGGSGATPAGDPPSGVATGGTGNGGSGGPGAVRITWKTRVEE